MSRMPSKSSVGLLFLALFFLSIRPARAYIDPGTGSLIFQMLVASMLTGLFMFRRAIRYLFHSLFRRNAAKQEPPAPAPDHDVPLDE
jgi:hypothetical protein